MATNPIIEGEFFFFLSGTLFLLHHMLFEQCLPHFDGRRSADVTIADGRDGRECPVDGVDVPLGIRGDTTLEQPTPSNPTVRVLDDANQVVRAAENVAKKKKKNKVACAKGRE